MTNLYVNTYTDPNHARDAEIKKCLELNCAVFDDVVEIEGRPTYQQFFDVVNRHTGEYDINIIANSDIFFKELPVEWFANLTFDKAYCLTRWDYLYDGKKVFYNNSGSQDTWIFRGKIKPVDEATFTQGVAGCDNKIAYLLHQAGYEVSNPSLTIKSYHLHNSNVRHYGKNQKDMFRLPHPRINVKITAL